MLQKLKRWFELRYGSLLSHYPTTEWTLPNKDRVCINNHGGGVRLSITRGGLSPYYRSAEDIFSFQEKMGFANLIWGREFYWSGLLLPAGGGIGGGITSIPEEVKDILLPLLYSLPQIVKKTIDTRVEAQTKKEQKRRETLAQYVEMLKEGADAKNV